MLILMSHPYKHSVFMHMQVTCCCTQSLMPSLVPSASLISVSVQGSKQCCLWC